MGKHEQVLFQFLNSRNNFWKSPHNSRIFSADPSNQYQRRENNQWNHWNIPISLTFGGSLGIVLFVWFLLGSIRCFKDFWSVLATSCLYIVCFFWWNLVWSNLHIQNRTSKTLMILIPQNNPNVPPSNLKLIRLESVHNLYIANSYQC